VYGIPVGEEKQIFALFTDVLTFYMIPNTKFRSPFVTHLSVFWSMYNAKFSRFYQRPRIHVPLYSKPKNWKPEKNSIGWNLGEAVSKI
jgi:hypothetical protein